MAKRRRPSRRLAIAPPIDAAEVSSRARTLRGQAALMRDLARFPEQDLEIRECLHRLAQWREEVANGIESSPESAPSNRSFAD
jgi:hypothetical protein